MHKTKKMNVKNNNIKKPRTSLKNKINHYILKKQDIFCEKDIKREIVIEQIFENYKQMFNNPNEQDEDLNWLINDLLIFIGFMFDLKVDKDEEGIKLSKEIEKKITKNKKADKEKIIVLLNTIPLYYLLAFSGQSFYKYKMWANLS